MKTAGCIYVALARWRHIHPASARPGASTAGAGIFRPDRPGSTSTSRTAERGMARARRLLRFGIGREVGRKTVGGAQSTRTLSSDPRSDRARSVL
jgi:hypothetical protein